MRLLLVFVLYKLIFVLYIYEYPTNFENSQHKSCLFQEQSDLCTILTNYGPQRVYEFNNLPDHLRRYQQLGISDFWGSYKERVDSGGCAPCGVMKG